MGLFMKLLLTTAQRHLLDLVRTSAVVSTPMPSTRTPENQKLLLELYVADLLETVKHGSRIDVRIYQLTSEGEEALKTGKLPSSTTMSSESSAKPKPRSTHGASNSMAKKTSKRALKADPPKDYEAKLPLDSGEKIHVAGRGSGIFVTVESKWLRSSKEVEMMLTDVESEELQYMIQHAREIHRLIKKASQ